MKTYKHLFDYMIQPRVVAQCMLDAAEGKTKREEVMYAITHFDKTYDLVVKKAKDPAYRPCEDNVHEIIDGANNKPREIEKPKFCPEQILHHMIIEPFKNVLMDGLYSEVYGCLPPKMVKIGEGEYKEKNFGPHAAIKRLKKWVQNGKKTYVCESDIHHAYASVIISVLIRMLKEVVKDDEWIRVVSQFLHYYPEEEGSDDVRGLILGHYTSPWFFNFYLKKFDHYMASIDGVKYLRYADNMYLVGHNKKKMHIALELMKSYLKWHLGMALNSCTQIYRFEHVGKDGKVYGRAVNALGCVIHHDRMTLRKSILERFRRKANKVKHKDKMTWHDGNSIFSRFAAIRFTDTKTYCNKYIKPGLNTRELKQRVRTHTKHMLPEIQERRRIINDGLAKSTRLAGDTA